MQAELSVLIGGVLAIVNSVIVLILGEKIRERRHRRRRDRHP